MPSSRFSRPIPERLAVVEEKVDDLEQEVSKHRVELHEWRTDRIVLQQLIKQFDKFVNSIPEVAKQAALETFDLAMEHRDELGHRRWTLRLQWIGTGIAAGGLLAAAVGAIVHFF
jgi:hypothetical protein